MARGLGSKVNGLEFESRMAACRYYDVSYGKVNERIIKGMTLEEAINDLLRKGDTLGTAIEADSEEELEEEENPIVVRGVTYRHVIEVASYYEIPYLTFMLLYDELKDAEKALDAYLKRVEEKKSLEARRRKEGVQTHLYRGVEYASREEVAEVMGVSLSTLEKLVAGRSYDEVGDMISMMNVLLKKDRK